MRKTLLHGVLAATILNTPAAWADSLSDARQGAQRGSAIFQKTYGDTGMGGLIGASKSCWKAFRAKPSVRKLGECGSLDFHSYNLDNTANKQMGWDPVPYMTLDKVTDRYGEGEKVLKMSAKKKDTIQNIVVASVPFGR